MDIVVKSPSGDAKLTLIAELQPGQLPYSYLKSSATWRPFWCTPDQQFESSPVIVKAVSLPKHQSSTSPKSYMAVCEHAGNGLWMFCRIDSHVRVKDVKALVSLDAPRSRRDVDLANLIQSWTIQPNWSATESSIKLDMSYKPVETKVPHTSPAEELKLRYLETLYSQTPLTYFAKSTLSRIRASCRDLHDGTDEKRYQLSLSRCLKSVVFDIYTLNDKFTDSTLPPDEEKKYYEKAVGETSGTQKANVLENLKLREIQLQIIVLLELMTISDSNTDESPPPVVSKPKRPSLVRRKKPAKQSAPIVVPPEMLPSVQVDVLFDRLCIFQALEGLTEQKLQPSLSAQKNTHHDKILEFCMEVILPFYGNKLPVFIKSMVKKVKGTATKWVSRKTLESEKKTQDMPNSAQLSSGSIKLDISPSLAGRTKSSKSLATSQKRQVEHFSSFKAIRNENIEYELAQAIKTISKPNRVAASLGGEAYRVQQKKENESRPDIQVTMTPVKKKRVSPELLHLDRPVTPTKRLKFDEIISSPLSYIETDDDEEVEG